MESPPPSLPDFLLHLQSLNSRHPWITWWLHRPVTSACFSHKGVQEPVALQPAWVMRSLGVVLQCSGPADWGGGGGVSSLLGLSNTRCCATAFLSHLSPAVRANWTLPTLSSPDSLGDVTEAKLPKTEVQHNCDHVANTPLQTPAAAAASQSSELARRSRDTGEEGQSQGETLQWMA